MITRKLEYFILIILSFSVMFMSACSEKDGSGYLFKYSLLNDPKILDPQLATDTSSLIVIQNMYCGLLKISENGKLTEGVSSKYTVSDDGLKYTFELRNDMYWGNTDSDYKVQVTARDFVFAFKRIFNKNTKSPYTTTFSSIKNAKKIISGELDENSLGVYAVNDYTLEINLDNLDINFLSLLTTSAAMPCNEEFFNKTKGKYGLEPDASISNGSFYLKEWKYDPYGQNNYIILRKNKYFSDVKKVYPSSLNFFIENDSEKINDDFFNNTTDCIVLGQQNKKSLNGYAVDGYEIISSGIVFNDASDFFSNRDLREGLTFSIDRNEYKDNFNNSGRAAYAIVPFGITMLNKSYRELVSETDKSLYNLNEAKNKWSQGLSSLGKLSIDSVKILVPQSFNNPEWIKFVTQQWQSKLDFYCGIEVVSDKVYNTKISEGDYQIAFYQFTSQYDNPKSILSNFATNDPGNRIGYSNASFDVLLENSSKVKNLNESVMIYNEAEKVIINDCIYMPLFYQKEFLVYKNSISDIQYNPFTKQIDFTSAKNFN